jgi:hypothetical protein
LIHEPNDTAVIARKYSEFFVDYGGSASTLRPL